MSSQKINNSFLKEKVVFRIKHLPDINAINVLDCFHGNGCIWYNVRRNIKRDISVFGIDIQEYDEFSLVGDNLKILPNLDLDAFNVIDVDAYGSPYEQVKIISGKIKTPTLVFYTFIQTMLGRCNFDMLQDLGYSHAMLEKCPSLFSKDGHVKFMRWLAILGVERVSYVNPKGRKYYGCFTLPPQTDPACPKERCNAHRP